MRNVENAKGISSAKGSLHSPNLVNVNSRTAKTKCMHGLRGIGRVCRVCQIAIAPRCCI